MIHNLFFSVFCSKTTLYFRDDDRLQNIYVVSNDNGVLNWKPYIFLCWPVYLDPLEIQLSDLDAGQLLGLQRGLLQPLQWHRQFVHLAKSKHYIGSSVNGTSSHPELIFTMGLSLGRILCCSRTARICWTHSSTLLFMVLITSSGFSGFSYAYRPFG